MTEKGYEAVDPLNNNPFTKTGNSSDTIDFEITPEEALAAEEAIYKTLDYAGPDRGKLNTTMSALREEDQEKYKKAA